MDTIIVEVEKFERMLAKQLSDEYARNKFFRPLQPGGAGNCCPRNYIAGDCWISC
jgi:hypothetical protein